MTIISFKLNIKTLLSNRKGQRQAFPNSQTPPNSNLLQNVVGLMTIGQYHSFRYKCNLGVIMMTKKGCTCLIYPKPLIKKMVHKGGGVAASDFPGGSPLVGSRPGGGDRQRHQKKCHRKTGQHNTPGHMSKLQVIPSRNSDGYRLL